jgi:hypothetical protein
MRSVGFLGGHTVYELGSASDVEIFFNFLGKFVVKKFGYDDWELLTSRLYKRYLRLDELEHAAALMSQVRNEFSILEKTSLDWGEVMRVDRGKTCLDLNKDSLGGIFFKYFESFFLAKNSAMSFFEAFGIYQPVRLVVSDMPMLVVEKKRSLEEYDGLSNGDLPFWLR